VAHIELHTQFEYVAVPIKSDQAFLKAIATNNSPYTLLGGPMNVFMNNFFVANSRITTTAAGEQFKLYLGSDNSIKVDLKPIDKSDAKIGFISKSNTRTSIYTTEISNNKSEDIEVLVFQQLPFATDERIKINIKEPYIKDNPNVSVDEFSLLKWRTKVKAGGKSKLRFCYNIEFPNDKEILFVKQADNKHF